jgi:hypothetical protein
MHRLPTWFSPGKDHSHYGAETQNLLKKYQEMWISYHNTTWINFKENSHRLDTIQAAWDALVKARKQETGSGFYLNKQEYDNVYNR